MRKAERTVSALHQATPIRSSGREPLRNGLSHLTPLAPLEARHSSCCVSGPRADDGTTSPTPPHLPSAPIHLLSSPLPSCACMLSHFSRVWLCDPMDCSPPDSSVHGILQARITGVGCHALLQEIFPVQGSNPHLFCLLHWQVGSLPLAPPGKPCPPPHSPQLFSKGTFGVEGSCNCLPCPKALSLSVLC